MKILELDGKSLNFNKLELYINKKVEVAVAEASMSKIRKARDYVEDKLKSDQPFYGINTGFGMLAYKKISNNELNKLQENLIVSHAAGTGNYFPEHISRLIMLLRLNVLAAGYSGIRPETVQTFVDIINKGIVPLIPDTGSVGASGDLSPLAHVALTLIGKGNVIYKNKIMHATHALKDAGIKPVELEAKEGIALINGTQAMTSLMSLALIKAEYLIKLADIAGAMSIEGDMASQRPFDTRLHNVRPHKGQIATADNIRILINESQIIKSHKDCKRVQDPYCLRCIPQVHGAIKDTYNYVKQVVETELNSCTDNPLVFCDDDEIISGGNFHGEPLAIVADFLSIAMAELGSISERRVAILLSPLENELPSKYLVDNPGLNSGLAPMHVTMASLVSENKTLAHPASVDTIPTFAGQEDHVSMGFWGAKKCINIIDNVEKILSMELLAACQAIDLQTRHNAINASPGKGTLVAYQLFREHVKYLDHDRESYLDIEKAINCVKKGEIISKVENNIGKLNI